MKKLTFNTKYFVIAGLLGLMSGPVTADVPNTFAAGDTIRASEMNANFSALVTRITALESHVADTTNPHEVDKTQVGLGNVENSQVRFAAITSPTATDDSNAGYAVGTLWVNTSTTQAYVLLDATAGAAVWKQIPRSYAVGDTGPAGGKVFYTTDSGLHGLEAAPADQSTAIWGCSGGGIPDALGTAIGTGAANTAAIVEGCLTDGTAAKVADAYTLNGYNDWFLPSKDELNQLYLQKDVVGGFDSLGYWSSSEINSSNAWSQFFSNGVQGSDSKNSALAVRAVRAF